MMPKIVSRLPSGGADVSQSTVLPWQVLEPNKFVDKDGNLGTGTMPNKHGEIINLPVNGKVPISAGYHDGSGYATQNIPSIVPDYINQYPAGSVAVGAYSGDGVTYAYLLQLALSGKYNNGIEALRFPIPDVLNAAGAKRHASGSVDTSGIATTILYGTMNGSQNQSTGIRSFTVTGLKFKPSIVKTTIGNFIGTYCDNYYTIYNTNSKVQWTFPSASAMHSDGFTLQNLDVSNNIISWEAFE